MSLHVNNNLRKKKVVHKTKRVFIVDIATIELLDSPQNLGYPNEIIEQYPFLYPPLKTT